MNATPRFLVVARCSGRNNSDKVGTPGEDGNALRALERELLETKGEVSHVYEHAPYVIDQFEIYVIGRGNENSPVIVDPDDVERRLDIDD